MDTLGRRTKKTVSGVTTNYFYSGSVVISEQQGSTWTDYIFFGGQRIAKQTGSTSTTATYLHTDHLGSTRSCTDSSGNSNGSCDYEPFGEFQPGSSCSNLPTNYRFAAMEYDSETGLYHTQFRQYDVNQGRWMAVDSIPGKPDTPQSQDRYAYVLNDPVNNIDPLGLLCTDVYWIHLEFVYVNGSWVLDPLASFSKLIGQFCTGRDGDRGGSGGPKPDPEKDRKAALDRALQDACRKFIEKMLKNLFESLLRVPVPDLLTGVDRIRTALKDAQLVQTNQISPYGYFVPASTSGNTITLYPSYQSENGVLVLLHEAFHLDKVTGGGAHFNDTQLAFAAGFKATPDYLKKDPVSQLLDASRFFTQQLETACGSK